MLEIVGKLLDNTGFNKPEFSLVDVSRVENVLWSENDPLYNMCDGPQGLISEFGHRIALHQNINITLVQKSGFERGS
jgi:hypothetical protein